MKTWIAALTLLLSVSAFATEQEVQFSYSGEMGQTTYYHCDYVEAQAERYLELLGATDIRTTRWGGLRSGWSSPVALRANFNLPQVTDSHVEMVEIRSEHWFPACGLNTRMIRTFLKAMPHVTVVEKRDLCGHPNAHFFYKLNIQL